MLAEPTAETTVAETAAPKKTMEPIPKETESVIKTPKTETTASSVSERPEQKPAPEITAVIAVEQRIRGARYGKNMTRRLVIYYKFVGYLDIDPTQCHPNYTADIREGVAVEYVSCEPIPEVTYTPDISAEARKEYAERVMKKHKEKAEQG